MGEVGEKSSPRASVVLRRPLLRLEPGCGSDLGSAPLSQAAGTSGIVASLAPFAQPALLLISNSFNLYFRVFQPVYP